jgi:hypothetical protein
MVNRAKRPDRRHLIAAAHPKRRDGAIALALFVLPWVAAVILVRRHHHLDGGTVGILVAVSLGLPTLWLTWAAFRGPRRAATSASGLSMGQLADQLAVAVGAQWTAEAGMRRLNDPYPLPVSWTAADPSLTDAWDSLMKLAASGAGWPAPPPAERWAAGPDDLAGEGGELAEVLARVPTGRLVVLGEPGAGKTMLMVRLVLDLLSHRTSGSPVPFLASVASWNPTAQDLRGWLSDQLLTNYPALASLPPEGMAEPTQADALLASGLILPVLDGLDEIPEKVRGPAISRINDTLRPGEHMVVTCRTQQYRDAVRPANGSEVILRAAAAVQMRPLDAEAVRNYFCDDAAGPVTRARWAPVLAVLDTAASAAQALSTPLMVGLARAIYNPRPGEPDGSLRDPAELCNPDLDDRTAVESLLFDAFIPAAYRDDAASRWKAQDAEKWLVFLARHLEHTIGATDFAWWRLPLAVRGFVPVSGVVAGLLIGIDAGVLFGIGSWVPNGLDITYGVGGEVIAGAVAGVLLGFPVGVFAPERKLPKPVRGIRWQPPRGWAAAIAIAIAFGLWFGLKYGVGIGILSGAETILMAGALWLVLQRGAPLDLNSAADPNAVLASDRSTGTTLGAMFGVVIGGLAGILLGTGLWSGVVFGAATAIAAGIICSFALAAWPSYGIVRIWLALRHRLPWPLMDFLADAHRRGVLRQAGAVYQFRHIELQHRLAKRGTARK